MGENKTGLIIVVLVLIVLILLGIVVYAFVINPAIDRYIISTQNQGAQLAVNYIADLAKQCQTVPINIGENQTINLIAIECLQAPPSS